MHYTGNIIRPPSEADSIILQVTVGCSHNRCTFCGAYKDTTFAIKPMELIENDLLFAGQHFRDKTRLFLCDGDVLILSQIRLLRIFRAIRHHLPWIKRISLYANGKAMRNKDEKELSTLKDLGLDRIYTGLESGCDRVLQRIQKGETAQNMIKAAQRINDIGIFLSVTVLLGIAGRKDSLRHGVDTAETLNKMAPRQIGALTYMPMANTPLGQEVERNTFQLLYPREILRELLVLINNLDLNRCQFHANHSSNYLPISGRLAKDKQLLMATVTRALQGELSINPDYIRSL